MKFVYIDESGTGDEPFAVMAGIIVDAQRMKPTKDEWAGLLLYLSEEIGREVTEFHTRDFYRGNKIWRGMNGEMRGRVITAILNWVKERRHSIVFSAIDKEAYRDNFSDHAFTGSIGNIWKTLATHIALSLQRAHQSQKNNKGNTILIFDSHEKDQRDYAELILNPPEWTNSYYNRNPRSEPLDQLVDVPHFVDSKHVGMIQLADCISYFLRRHIELASNHDHDRYAGEAQVVADWYNSIIERCNSLSSIYPKRGRCDAANYFYDLCPEVLK